MVVNLYEIPQPIALPAPLTEFRHDVLYEAVSIFFLVRHQLQSINQISAKALRYCMRSEDLGLINTFTCLHHQKPVWLPPVVFLSTDRAPPFVTPFSPRDPPNVVFQQETVTMRARIPVTRGRVTKRVLCCKKMPNLKNHVFWMALFSLTGPVFPAPQCLQPINLPSRFFPQPVRIRGIFLARLSCQIGGALTGLLQKSDNTQPLLQKVSRVL